MERFSFNIYIMYECLYVYFLKNIDNGKIYIGSTNNFERRKSQHFNMILAGKHSNKNITADIINGFNNFEMFIVSEINQAPIKWIRFIEKMWIEYLYTTFDLYNVNFNTFGFSKLPEHNRAEIKQYRQLRKLEMLKATKMIENKHKTHISSFELNAF